MAASGGRSVLSGEPADECHHVVAKGWLRRNGFAAHVWDPRNGVALTSAEHTAHTSRLRPLPRVALPAQVFDFARELGIEHYLDRHYPEG